MSLSGNPLDFILAFSGGVLVSFTPCIYPLLPITIAYIGSSAEGSRIKGFTLSLAYVTGMSVVYAILGLIAVLTGTFFGRYTNQPWVRIVVGLVIILFGFLLWTDRGLRLPGLKLTRGLKPQGHFSSFLLGFASGFAISPCVFPILGSILAFVSSTRNFAYGAGLLFCFAFGMGMLLILAGTFSSILTALPKSGSWMVAIKKISAVVLITVGVIFVSLGVTNILGNFCSVERVWAKGLENSRIAPNFTLFDQYAEKTTLSDFRNKKSVVLLFWTTWCPYCARELRYLNQIHPQLSANGTEILAINVQESKIKVKRFLRKISVVYKVLLDFTAKVTDDYELRGVPTFVLINKRGDIVFYDNYFPKKNYKRILAEQ